jgi:hypothetical protein
MQKLNRRIEGIMGLYVNPAQTHINTIAYSCKHIHTKRFGSRKVKRN